MKGRPAVTNQLAPRDSLELANLGAQLREYAQASTSDSTKAAYQSDWQHFEAWATSQGLEALPAEPMTICAYLGFLADSFKISTIRRRMVAISRIHETQGYTSPTKNPVVRSVLEGMSRKIGTKQEKKKPINTAQIKSWVDSLEDTLQDTRDKAVILFGFAGAFRRSEIAALDVEDIEFSPQGMVVTVRKSKTDQTGEGEQVAIPYGKHPQTCPVLALQKWLDSAGIKSGPVFRSFWKSGKVREGKISPKAIALIVKRMVTDLGLNPLDYAGHSLRAGHVTQAIENGAEPLITMEQTRHKSEVVFRGYVRRGNLFTKNSATHLGL